MIVTDYFDIIDQSGGSTGYIFLRRPVSNLKLWKSVKRRYAGRILGMSSLCGFPRRYPELLKNCSGWCHVFRNPRDFDIPSNMPSILLGESDFVPCYNITKSKKFDFWYVCQGSANQRSTKNFGLFVNSLPILCGDMGLKCVLIGMKLPKDLLPFKNNIVATGNMDHSKVIKLMAASKFGFVPNIRDASPKIITESLSVNVPCLINENILGGWKYVNSQTGEFFHDTDDVGQMASIILTGSYSPKKWYASNSGPVVSGKRLLSFMKSIYPNNRELGKCVYLGIKSRDQSWFRFQ